MLSPDKKNNRSRSNSESYDTETSIPSHIFRSRSSTQRFSKGDTYTILNDALRLQSSVKQTIDLFTFKKKICKELLVQIEECDIYVEEQIATYSDNKPFLESKQYFIAFMEYIEALNKTLEFIYLLKDKGLFSRLRNQDKYREATRVHAIEIGRAVSFLKSLKAGLYKSELSSKIVIGTVLSNNTMGTINGTLKLLNDNLFSEQEIKIEGLFKDDINNEIEIKNYRIVRRNIRRTLDSQPRMGINFKLYKARYNHNIVAEKVYQDIDPQFLKGIQQEVLKWIQQRANNYVAWVHGLWVEGSSIGIVSDYFEAGSLQQLVSKHANEGTEIDLLTRLRFTHNIIEAVANLHSIGIIHGGLNPRNLLVTSNLTLQFGGFETIQLRLLGEGREAYYPYTPPEILEKEDPTSGLFTKKGDVYSLGMILGSIWTTSFPYDIPEPSDSLSLKKSILEGTKPIWVKNLSGPTLSFIERCIDMNPEIRPTSYEMEKEMRSIFTNGTTLLNSPNSLNPTKSKSTIDPLLLNEPSLDYSYDYYSGYSLSPKPYMNFDSATSLSSLIDGFKSMHISTPKRIESLSPNASPALNQDVLEFPNIAYNESVSSTQTSKDTNLTLNTSLLSNLTQDEVLSPGSGISLSDAIYFHNTQQYEKAYAYFLYLSEVEGKAEAIYYIGLYHYTGKPGFLAPNLHLALSYLQRAAKGGCGDAYDYLGLHYLDSGPDFAKAFSHFHAAARHLSSPGCYHLSQCYKNGHGTNIDPELALYNLQLAASLGYGPAKNMLEQEMQLNSRHLYKIEERSSEAPDIVIEDTSN